MPTNENQVDKDIKPTFFDLKYLKAKYNSKDLITLKLNHIFINKIKNFI